METNTPDDATFAFPTEALTADPAATPAVDMGTAKLAVNGADRADEISRHMYIHMEDGISVEELCRISSTTGNVFRAFQRKFGITPYQYILKSKFESTRILLSSGEVTVEEVAERMYYSSAGHFLDIFYKYHGMHPSEYRRIYQGT